MKFKFPLYHYQEDVLNVFHKEIDRWDTKIHIVAPPWSWKTIMWLEMISRLEWNHLILVPNLTLQYQWKDKIEKFFLEEWEKIENLVSTRTQEIKKINIITYQSLTSSNNNNDLIMDQIINYWFEDIKW
jgi:superfamily II DNA or RNA helicase